MAHIQYLTQIHLDPGVVRRLPEECARVAITRPLVISDAGVRAAGVLDQALAALGATPHAVVARNSLHLQGQAIDVRLTGASTRSVRRAAVSIRRGGVGYYPDSDFVHLDTGRVRAW